MVPVIDVADLPRGAHYEGETYATLALVGNGFTHRIYSRRNGTLVAVEIEADRARCRARKAAKS